MNSMIVPVAAMLLGALGVVENTLHQRRIRAIPIRINVNGTRGKSTVTRLIAAGLRSGGLRTVGKTTGTAPRLMLPDGSEEPIRRRGRARISEHIAVAKRAFGEGADALVVECMALTPENQAVYEHVLVRSTIGVITNIRPDHLEVMGPGLEDVAETLALTVPDRGKLVTLDGPHLDVIRQECARRDASLHLADPASVSEEELAQFRYTSFAENVALALLACELAGVDRAIALRGMVQALPDPGVSPVVSLAVDGRSLRIVNAFAANDVESTLKMWEDFVEPHVSDHDRTFVMVNNRSDRPHRVEEMSRMAASLPVDCLFYVGDLQRLAVRLTPAGKAPVVLALGSRRPAEILQQVAARVPEGGSAILFLVGNMKGAGSSLTEEIAARTGAVSA